MTGLGNEGAVATVDEVDGRDDTDGEGVRAGFTGRRKRGTGVLGRGGSVVDETTG